METTIYKRPIKTAMEVFDILPEGTLCFVYKNTLYMSPAPNQYHQQILNRINVLLSNFVNLNELGLVYVAPTDVRFDEETAFQPDIFFISQENFEKISERGIEGAPDLIIEILSPSNYKFDLKEKKEAYEQHGVKEYWTVDPETKKSTGFFLKGKSYQTIGKFKGELRSKLLNTVFKF